jgi:hypothetical protein
MMFRNPFSNPKNEGFRVDPSGNTQDLNPQNKQPGNKQQQTKGGGGGSINDPQNFGMDDQQQQDDNDNPTNKTNKTVVDGDDPSANLASLWDDPPDDPANPKKPEPTTYLPALDPKKLNDILGKLDFTRSVKKETWDKVKAGGDDAIVALGEILNGSLRQALAVGFNASSRLVETGLSSAKDRFTGSISDHVKDVMIGSNLSESNPFVSDPAFAPVVDSVRQRLQNKYPKATPKQIEQATNKYFDNMYETGAKARQSKQTQTEDNSQKLRKGDAGADFEAWLNDEINATSTTQ